MEKNKVAKCYAMERENDTAEITMYGDIVDARPLDYDTGEPISGDFIIQDEFLADLDRMAGCKKYTLRMNSCGGDAGVSVLIHNRLRELANAGAELECIVDGCAMSGGSLIMCACDKVKVNPSSLVMIHKCWSFLFGAYNADDLRNAAKTNDAYDKAQVAIYKRKCNLDDDKILSMMGKTTYMTGKEAIEKGFADEMIDGETAIAASADGRSLFVNGREMKLPRGEFAPDTIPTVSSNTAGADKSTVLNAQEENEMTVAELREKYPEQIAEVEAGARASVEAEIKNAVNAERDRLKDIDDVASLFDGETVTEAKYGETACSAQELAYRVAQKAKGQGKAFLASVQKDADASNAAQVASIPSADVVTEPTTFEAKMAKAREEIKGLIHKEE